MSLFSSVKWRAFQIIKQTTIASPRNTLVVQVDLQKFCPEFCAFHSIMQQMLATKKQPFMTLRDTHTH